MSDVDYPWGSMQWLAGHRGQQASTLSVAKMTLRAGARNERHLHAGCDEVMFVVRGTVRHDLESKSHVQRAGEWLLVPRGTRHFTENIGADDAELFVTYGAPERDYVAVPE